MSKDRTQPYWGLTSDFRFAISKLGNPVEVEWGDNNFLEFLTILGGLIQRHANFNHKSLITNRMFFEHSDPGNQYFIGMCYYEDLVKFVDPAYGSPFRVKSNSTYDFPGELFGDIEHYYETAKDNSLKNNLLYTYSLRGMKQVSGKWPFYFEDRPDGIYVEDYWPRPWKGYTLCSLGLSMSGHDIKKMEHAPAKITILKVKEYHKLVRQLGDSYIELEQICSQFDQEEDYF